MANGNLNLLVVEDNPGDAGLLRAALEDVPGATYALAWAPSLAAADEHLKRQEFDAVLLDLDLGPTQGLGTLSWLQGRHPAVPVVVLTGRDDVTTGVRAVQAGAQDYLVKGRAEGDRIWRAVCYAVERHRAEQTIRNLNETLERRVDLRTRELTLANEEMLAFVRSCAHDLRGPLRTVEGLLSLIIEEQGNRLDADGMDLLERTRRAVERQDATLAALTRYAGVASTRLDHHAVDLVAMAREIVRDLRRHSPARNVDLRLPDRLPVTGDPGTLRLALENLLSNAWKFTAGREPAVIELGRLDDRDPPAYFVRDNGAGFDPRFTHKLFKPFQRLHDERMYPGAGLGLTTVLRVARLHGGTVSAEAEVDRGATFTFTLAPEAHPDAPPSRS